MTTKDFKNLVQQIQKMASPPPPPPTGYVPESRSSVPTPRNQGGAPTVYHGGDSGIKKMQEAIIQLSRDVVSQMKGSGKTDQRSQQEASGRESFGDFLAKTFMRNSHVPAVEYSPDPKKTQMEEKDPTQANKMSWVMDTINRIGRAVSETFADGVWGPRTHAALVNIIAFADGLFKVAEAYGIHPKSYNQEYLRQLQPIVTEDKKMDATTLAKHINLIRKMYDEVKEQVLQTPQYQTYIERDTPYIQHEKTSFDPTPQQLESMKRTFPGWNVQLITTEQGTKVSAQITVDDLSSPEKFTAWMQSRGVALEPGQVLEQVTSQIVPAQQG
jgi:hypothetical protein